MSALERSVEPDVSVVVPTRDRAGFLGRLLDALDEQSIGRDRFEVVIVDDGSRDATPDVIAAVERSGRLHVRTLRLDGTGAARARNAGWRASRAPVVAFTDDDCVPGPRWLEEGLAMMALDPAVGVVQGRSVIPDDAVLGDWTVTREVRSATPWFESHNIFYRRAALDQTAGFDEQLGIYGEDTTLGWEVMRHGWARAFADDAMVAHECEDRGLGWVVRNAYVNERNIVSVAARFPEFRRAAFWHRWVLHREDVHFVLALVGLLLACRRPRWLVLTLPYLWTRRPPAKHHRAAALRAERFLVDLSALAGRAVGSVRHRCLVL